MSKRPRRCPLCGSRVSERAYMDVLGVWQERRRLEENLRIKQARLRADQKTLDNKIRRAAEHAAKQATIRAQRRAEQMARSIESQSRQIESLTGTIRDLREQLRRGTTPQLEGLKYERT